MPEVGKPATEDALLNPNETSALLGVTNGTLAVWRSTGRYQLPYLKIGRKVYYRRGDINAWLQGRCHTHTSNGV